MTHDSFEKLLNRRFDLIRKSLNKKSAEYSSSDDKLHNFKMTLQMRRGKSPHQCLQGMLDKHLTAYFDTLDSGKKMTQDEIDERFGDIINYFILHEALYTENQLV